MKSIKKRWSKEDKEIVYINPDKQKYIYIETNEELIPMFIRDNGHMELWTKTEIDDYNKWGEQQNGNH